MTTNVARSNSDVHDVKRMDDTPLPWQSQSHPLTYA